MRALVSSQVADLNYMLKPAGVVVTMDNIQSSLQYGVVRDSAVSDSP